MTLSKLILEKIDAIEEERNQWLLDLAQAIRHQLVTLEPDTSATRQNEELLVGFKSGHKQARHKAAEMIVEAIEGFVKNY